MKHLDIVPTSLSSRKVWTRQTTDQVPFS